MKQEVKAVIFDIGDVLVMSKHPLKKYKNKTHHLGVHETFAKALNISLDQYFDSIDTTYARSIEGKISRERVLKILSKNFKISKKKLISLYSQIYAKGFSQNKELLKKAFELKRLKYKIAVLTDQWHLSKQILVPGKIYKKFNVVVASCDVGVRKPDSKAYELVLKKLKIKPAQAVFLDNQKWNIDAAKKIGMKAILFKNNRTLFKNPLWRGLFR